MGKMTIQQMLIQLAGGMGTSIQIFLVTLISFPPSWAFWWPLVVCPKPAAPGRCQGIHIHHERARPWMLQLMVVYFDPYYLFRIKVGSGYRLWATFIGFGGSIMLPILLEIYRSGIQSMPVGQYEAAPDSGLQPVPDLLQNHTAPRSSNGFFRL